MHFLPLFTGIRHLAHVLTVPPTKACLLCATPAGMDLYIQVHARRNILSVVPWISEDSLLVDCMLRETKASSAALFKTYLKDECCPPLPGLPRMIHLPLIVSLHHSIPSGLHSRLTTAVPAPSALQCGRRGKVMVTLTWQSMHVQ